MSGKTTLLNQYELYELSDYNRLKPVDKNIRAFKVDLQSIKLNFPIKVGCFCIFFIKSGDLRLNLDLRDIKLKQSTILQIFPNNTIEFKEISEDLVIECLLVSIDYFDDLNLKWSSYESLEVLSNNYSKVISVDENVALSILFNLEKIKLLNIADAVNGFFNPQMLKLYFSLIIYDISNLRHVQLQNAENIVSFRREDIAIQFTNLVAIHFRLHKDVQYYADLMYISRTHLTRTIKDVLLKTPKKIIEDKIISEAKILLFKNDITIGQLMSELNFEDQGGFTKFFKKNAGLTPSAYRNSLVG